ncbi:MAG TPA: ubiquitin-like small modifier protein 1, partial [Ktedonobacterales bacterium]|nr:ubiquitin-like small modifier protein 1 [Ktedonobacterales bacterium]
RRFFMEMRAPVSSVTVLLPGVLTPRTGGARAVAVEGETVREVVASLESAFPGLRFNLCYETGELRPFVNIYVNGRNVRSLQGLETPVPTGATLHILPSVAGG